MNTAENKQLKEAIENELIAFKTELENNKQQRTILRKKIKGAENKLKIMDVVNARKLNQKKKNLIFLDEELEELWDNYSGQELRKGNKIEFQTTIVRLLKKILKSELK